MSAGPAAGLGLASSPLAAALTLATDLLDSTSQNVLGYTRWTPPQLAFLRSTSSRKLLRTGNQFGKTWCGAAEALYRCQGEHPHKTVRQGPIETWVLCKSWSQSLAIQGKLWALVPKAWLSPGQSYSPKTGFAGTEKCLQFANGSILRIKTVGQDALELESATIHYVWIDEPLGYADLWAALLMRLRRTGGDIAITMTAALAGGVAWLKDLAESGKVEDLHFRMVPENFVPEGADRPLETEDGVPMDRAWIDSQIAECLPWQIGVRCHGEWEYKLEGSALPAFNRAKHVVNGLQTSGHIAGEVEICLGLDYGEDALRTVGILAYVNTEGRYPRVYVVAEYAPEQASTMDQDADGLLQMLAGQGDHWRDLDHAWADKRYTGRTTRKNAKELLNEVAVRLRVTGELRPTIRVAKRGVKRDSFWPSVKWLHEAMIRPGHFYVDAECRWLIESLEKWQGGAKEPWKDAIDATRYATRAYWGPSIASGPSRVLRRRFGR